MPMSPYLRNVRQKVGNDLLLMPSITIIALITRAPGPLRGQFQPIQSIPSNPLQPQKP